MLARIGKWWWIWLLGSIASLVFILMKFVESFRQMMQNMDERTMMDTFLNLFLAVGIWGIIAQVFYCLFILSLAINIISVSARWWRRRHAIIT